METPKVFVLKVYQPFSLHKSIFDGENGERRVNNFQTRFIKAKEKTSSKFALDIHINFKDNQSSSEEEIQVKEEEA